MGELDIKKMKVAELREQLQKRGLSTDGLKADLVNRLQLRLDEEEFGALEAPPGEVASPAPAAAAPAAAPEPEPAKEESPPEKPEGAAPKESPAKEQVAEAQAEANVVEEPKEDKTESNQSPDQPAGKEMSFAEQKKARAARFGIPVVESGGAKKKKNQKKNEQKKKDTGAKGRHRKPERGPGDGNRDKKRQRKDQKPTDKKKEKEVLLPKDEIEKRLARAKKFGINDAKTEELKAMLRKHRFS